MVTGVFVSWELLFTLLANYSISFCNGASAVCLHFVQISRKDPQADTLVDYSTHITQDGRHKHILIWMTHVLIWMKHVYIRVNIRNPVTSSTIRHNNNKEEVNNNCRFTSQPGLCRISRGCS